MLHMWPCIKEKQLFHFIYSKYGNPLANQNCLQQRKTDTKLALLCCQAAARKGKNGYKRKFREYVERACFSPQKANDSVITA